jgi:hypothetical protein
MEIKQKFDLLKGTKNVLSLSAADIKTRTVPDAIRNVYLLLKLSENRINHFSKERILRQLSDQNERKKINIIHLDEYILPVSYNKPTNSIIININSFNTEDVASIEIRNLYACMVYAITFSELASKRSDVSDKYAVPIINFMLSLFVRLFGKSYGLLGVYASEINKLKFLLSCYVLDSFFGITGKENFSKSGNIGSFNYKEIEEELSKYDFSKIDDFILALSDFKVMPGINKYSFTDRILKLLSINFIPALEDISRFIAILTTSNIGGSNLIPTFLYTYNEGEFNKIMTISKGIFK